MSLLAIFALFRSDFRYRWSDLIGHSQLTLHYRWGGITGHSDNWKIFPQKFQLVLTKWGNIILFWGCAWITHILLRILGLKLKKSHIYFSIVGMRGVVGSFPGLAVRVDSEDHCMQPSEEGRWWCIQPGFKTHRQSQLRSKTDSTNGSTKWWLVNWFWTNSSLAFSFCCVLME